MPYFAGIDVGATNIKAVLLDDGQKQLRSLIMPTLGKKRKAQILKRVENAALMVCGPYKPDAIGIAIAGTLDARKTRVKRAPNLKAIEDVKAKDILSKRLKAPVFLENDARAAAIAESNACGKENGKTILLTIGTGIGSAIIENGKVTDKETELGHITVEKNGFKCGCGKKGCLETTANTAFIARTARQLSKGKKTILKKFDPIAVEEAAKKGDKAAIETMEELSQNLGKGLAKICELEKPNRILLSGGISNAAMIYGPATKKMKKLSKTASKVEVRKAESGYFSGATGAAIAAMQKTA